ncbi:MAG: Uncharacterized protein XE11_2137 [Methanomicrobiales archaeon 53_19]|nr:MAG: Uncharacterized protein XE11_2137 [Methanomicrobiales archaeon 53_19]
MASDQRNHIKQIRRKFKGSKFLRNGYYNLIKVFAAELYSKDTHFIFELIQNAEDNTYTAVEPSFSFQLVKSDPTDTPGSDGALVIHNNEVGFSRKNVDAICDVHQSTKTKVQGYIGEKGIGFKSVFRLTSNPHIFSNSYMFCLPERDEQIGMGYIVPQWVDEIPKDLDPLGTTIILPLDKPQFPYEHIEKMLREIDPVTILFLSKLKGITIETESEYQLSIRKDDEKSPLVRVLVDRNDHGDVLSYAHEFILHTRSFDKPSNINPESRTDIDSREVSIAFPLNSESPGAGKVFAYLPVREDTGLPFIINADFLLPSSREDIREGEPWNQWLRECIPDVFIEAFEKCLDLTEYRETVYRFIPLEAHAKFFERVVDTIQERLNVRDVVLTEPDGKKCKPSEAWTAGKNFRSLLSQEAYPEALLTNRLVMGSIETYKKQLQHIGVRGYTSEIVRQCFLESGWIEQHSLDWLLECYRYLSSITQISESSLIGCPIVPIEAEGGIQWSCVKEQPIYFECNEDCEQTLKDAPECAQIALAFLHKDFYRTIKDDKKICDWMTEKSGVKPFSKKSYVIDILESFKRGYKGLPEEDLVSVTYYLSQFAEMDGIDFKDIPVLLSNNWRVLLSDAKGQLGIQALITPEALDPEVGWQNIFATEKDRQHLVLLSNRYIYSDSKTGSVDGIENLWAKVGITRYPPPRIYMCDEYGSLTAYEKNCLSKHYSTRPKEITNWRSFELLNRFETLDEATRTKFSRSLIDWLNNQGEKIPWLGATANYFYRNAKWYSYESEILNSLRNIPWVPTTKGYTRPDEAFLPVGNIREIFSDSVPYFEGNLPKNVVKLLGIREQVTADELVAILEQQSRKRSGSRDFTERVYRYLASLSLDYDVKGRFRSGNLIFIPAETTPPRWVSTNEVVWKDRSDTLGDEFIYLEKYYPKLRDFFVGTLCVKKDVDIECFARRWLSLQDESNIDKQKVETILARIYQELRPVIKIGETERPAWWYGFDDTVRFWTQDSTFEPPESAFIPDDGELKQIFQESGVHLVWHPPKSSYTDWEEFYHAFGLRYLSDAVTSSVAGNNGCRPRGWSDLLTNSAKVLITTWIWEKYPADYKKLLQKEILNSFLSTTEALTGDLNVIYRLGKAEVEKPCNAYWEVDASRLLISEASNGRNKQAVARAIARGLMPNHAYIDLSDWIELVLGESNWEQRIQDKNWKVPDEVKAWMDSLIDDESIIVPEQEFELVTVAECCTEETMPTPPLPGGISSVPRSCDNVHTAHTGAATNDVIRAGEFRKDCVDPSPVAHHDLEATKFPEHEPRNPELRSARVAQKASMAPDRITETRERSVSVGQDEVKLEAEQYLRHQYTDSDEVMFCQICHKPLPFQLDDGTYYVEKCLFLPDLKKHHSQNYLALCPNHSAMFQHANASRNSMRHLFKNMQGDLLEIVLAKKPERIYFTKTHLADLNAVLASEESSYLGSRF